MVSIKILLFAGLVFNMGPGTFYCLPDQTINWEAREKARIKRLQIMEQGKIINDQESLLKSKQELIDEKEELLNTYRKPSQVTSWNQLVYCQ